MLNPRFLKEVLGQNIPSVKMLSKTNINGHRHPCISLFIIKQDTIGETKENNKWHSTQESSTWLFLCDISHITDGEQHTMLSEMFHYT